MTDPVSTVLVLGASSQVGRFVLPRLRARGYRVLAVSRRGRPSGYPELDGVTWLTPDEADARLAEPRYLVSAGPLDLAVEFARRLSTLAALAVTSSSSVLSKAESADPEERELMESLLAAEQRLRRLAGERNLPLLILRPTLIYGCGMDRNLTVLAGLVRRFGFLPVSTRAGGLRAPVHADDVARALVAGLEERSEREVVSPLCGGETVDYRGMLRRVFAALDRKPRFLTLPPRLFAAALTVARGLGVASSVSPEAVRRQAVNLVFDDQPAREQLGVTPRRFHPGTEAFHPPSPELIERLARGH